MYTVNVQAYQTEYLALAKLCSCTPKVIAGLEIPDKISSSSESSQIVYVREEIILRKKHTYINPVIKYFILF